MTEEDYILIDNYLKGRLSDDEKKQVHKRLNVDELFSDEFKIEQQLYLSLNKDHWGFVKKDSAEVLKYKQKLKEDDLQSLKKTLSNVNTDFNKPLKKIKKVYYYLAAASIAIILMIPFVFNQEISNQDLYNTYSSVDDLPSFVVRNSKNDLDVKLVKAQGYFEKKNFQEALTIFEPILENEKKNTSIYLYTGIAQTKLGRFKKAERTFNGFINSHPFEANIGHWYKALMYIKNNETNKALIQLEIIAKDSNNYNYKEAIELIKKIER